MSMVVLTRVQYKNFCPFSKKYIKKDNILCLFNKYQYSMFKNTIYEIFNKCFNDDIIELIIDYIGYKKYINRFGSLIYTYWENDTKKLKKNLKLLTYHSSDDSNSSDYSNTSEDDIDSNHDEFLPIYPYT